MNIPIWHPRVRAEALRYNLTDFQAWRRVNDRERIAEMNRAHRASNRAT